MLHSLLYFTAASRVAASATDNRTALVTQDKSESWKVEEWRCNLRLQSKPASLEDTFMAKFLQQQTQLSHRPVTVKAHFQLSAAASPITSQGLLLQPLNPGWLVICMPKKTMAEEECSSSGPRSPDIACFHLLI